MKSTYYQKKAYKTISLPEAYIIKIITFSLLVDLYIA